MPTIKTVYSVQPNIGDDALLVALPSIAGAQEILIYRAGGGDLFKDLPNDMVVEPGIYHGGNPILLEDFQIASYDNLEITVEKKDVFSTENYKGLFDIEYPLSPGASVDGKIKYIWDNVFTSPLGLYTHQGSVSDWNFNLDLEILQLQTNDVNVIPRIDDYIVFNKVPLGYTGYINGTLPNRLPYFKGTETFTVKVTDVLILSGTDVNIIYQLTLDKSFTLKNGDRYGIALLNRTNTSIQKELFYKTFEQIEIHREQLLGDTYFNDIDTSKPYGRKNFLNYKGADALGYQNLLKDIINDDKTPFMIFDISEEIKDRISFKPNKYSSAMIPDDVHFEFHLPSCMINENLFVSSGVPTSPVDASGNVLENILVSHPKTIDDKFIGLYSGMYLRNDKDYLYRFGYVCYDLRIVVIDHAELCTALSYNSNRNYTLPAPLFQPGSGNALKNPGSGTSLAITDATNTSPIVVTTSTTHGLPRGTVVYINDVKGNTAANGTWIVDITPGSSTPYKLELWQKLPTYVGGIRTPGTGIPVVGSGVFINDGIGKSGKMIGAFPDFSYFYTYRLRNYANNSTLPYATVTDFNFTLSGNVNNTEGSLYVNLPQMNWFKEQSNLLPYDLGFEMMDTADDLGYGIDLIIGKYTVNNDDPTAPTEITGIEDIVVIPMKDLTTGFSGDPLIGIVFEVKYVNDYKVAVDAIKTYDLLELDPLYTYNFRDISPILNTGDCKWTLGNINYRNHVEINRAHLKITVAAQNWNSSTNPSYKPSENKFIKNKYISEVAILIDKPEDPEEDPDYKPMIYAKIAPAIKKTQDLDLNIILSIDY